MEHLRLSVENVKEAIENLEAAFHAFESTGLLTEVNSRIGLSVLQRFVAQAHFVLESKRCTSDQEERISHCVKGPFVSHALTFVLMSPLSTFFLVS